MSPTAAKTPVAIADLTARESAARLGQFGPNEHAATRAVRGKAMGKREGVWPTL